MQPGGQLTTTNEVNWPGNPEGITGPEMMVQLQAQAERFGTDVRDGWATKVDFSGDIHKVWINDTIELHCETVIISTGATAKYLGLPSEQHYLKMGGGVSLCSLRWFSIEIKRLLSWEQIQLVRKHITYLNFVKGNDVSAK
jgi:thioredoxin reductase (NADPH)